MYHDAIQSGLKSFGFEKSAKLSSKIVVPKIQTKRASSAVKPLQIPTNDIETPSQQTRGNQ